jgi:hypothetical protein
LKSSLGAQSQDFNTAHSDILNKVAGLWDIFWQEKNDLVDRINQSTELLKKWIIWESQEEIAKTEGLTTRRWFWTKGMENLAKTSIANKELADVAGAEKAWVDQITNVTRMYNDLLANLLAQYKATKDTYVLWNIQNAVNVLNLLSQYKKGTTPKQVSPLTE